MSDTYRRYGAIKKALMQFYPPFCGHRERHFNTLSALICGLASARSSHLPVIASHAPTNGANQESLIKRFRRWLANTSTTSDTWFLPLAQALLANLAAQPLILAIDGSVVGRGCIALMVSVIYQGRALPLCWLVVSGKKGHFPQSMHCELLSLLEPLIPDGAEVTVVGDGEFDGTELQALLRQFGWQYVVRTAATVSMHVYGRWYAVNSMAPSRGELLGVRMAWVTAARYGPVSVLALWEKQYEEPIYLVTNLVDVDRAFALYRKRAHIETFFSDLKSRGFGIHKSHLSDPTRLTRLLIAACLAYVWLVYLGVCALEKRWMKRLHRSDRCDLSLFQLGMRLLDVCLNEGYTIPKGLLVPAAGPKRIEHHLLGYAA